MRRFQKAVSGVVLLGLLTSCGGGGGAETAVSTAKERPLVGVILPDRKSSARWEEQDRPRLNQALGFAGIEAMIDNADGDEAKFASIADSMIQRGVKVLMTTPLSPEGGAAVERKAKQAGIPVINYDRITIGGQADYYVSFDNINVGELQAEGLIGCLGDRPGADIIEIEGAPTDNNATQFADGHRRKLAAKYDSGAYDLVATQAIEQWDPVRGKAVFEQLLNGNGGRVDGVVAANDGLAASVIEVLRAKGLAGRVPVTGQDATLEGLRAILRGEQCMTVYKPIRDEAEAAAWLAVSLARGDISGADDLATGNTRDPVSRRDVKSVLLGADLITRNNLRTLVDDGIVRPADLCAGDVAADCAELGIRVG
ncbi:sugar ABC transporter substrate-binding protein [Saccharothrix coeruleofusca]|uniref:Sugar ABC transporter substrate-binding protein n=1 Tax=Saccharothrix coeruleofusca TaxID=33919 RepID=A0A918ECJ6_9PSEU|nr:substrate-binding domain-containing protein [Saccharothrix coeruleofusca]MBP2334033.1 D-xylose transport system substrate-binding protein [Saccharothrix coeruleofusca]GGP43897.1 sugar ABC transporter substrate-binding protein [Saccharothrix coeruleofusca]